MAFIMREQAVIANRMMERLDRESGRGNLDGAEVDFEYMKFTEFIKANPHSF